MAVRERTAPLLPHPVSLLQCQPACLNQSANEDYDAEFDVVSDALELAVAGTKNLVTRHLGGGLHGLSVPRFRAALPKGESDVPMESSKPPQASNGGSRASSRPARLGSSWIDATSAPSPATSIWRPRRWPSGSSGHRPTGRRAARASRRRRARGWRRSAATIASCAWSATMRKDRGLLRIAPCLNFAWSAARRRPPSLYIGMGRGLGVTPSEFCVVDAA